MTSGTESLCHYDERCRCTTCERYRTWGVLDDCDCARCHKRRVWVAAVESEAICREAMRRNRWAAAKAEERGQEVTG